MQVIPAINEVNFEAVEKRIRTLFDFEGSRPDWVHIDVSDGEFTKRKIYNDPLALKMSGLAKEINIGIHLMINYPDDFFEFWLDAGVKKIIVHVEAVKNIPLMKQQCDKAGAELVLAVSPNTGVEELFKYDFIGYFLILAVEPGFSGKPFDESQLEKIKILRSKIPSARIEVDGGVNLEIALKIKSAGANTIISASYIWNSGNPKETYDELLEI